jgi:hypothetical protein
VLLLHLDKAAQALYDGMSRDDRRPVSRGGHSEARVWHEHRAHRDGQYRALAHIAISVSYPVNMIGTSSVDTVVMSTIAMTLSTMPARLICGIVM